VVAGVVAHEPGEVRHLGAVAEHRLHADHLAAGVAVAEDAQPAGVGGDGAADGRGVAAGEVDAVGEVVARRGCLHRRDRHAAAGSDLGRGDVDGVEVGETGEAEHQLARERHAAADQPGVAALGHHGHALRRAGGDDRGHLHRGARPHHRGRRAHEAAGPVGGVARQHLGIGEHVLRAHDRDHVVEQARRQCGGGRCGHHLIMVPVTRAPDPRLRTCVAIRSFRSTSRVSPVVASPRPRWGAARCRGSSTA